MAPDEAIAQGLVAPTGLRLRLIVICKSLPSTTVIVVVDNKPLAQV